MSVTILHFNRHQFQFFTKAKNFAVSHGLQLRRIGQGSGDSSGAQVLVHEWQVDLLDHLPLYILNCSHVVVSTDLEIQFLQCYPRSVARVKTRREFF